MRFNSPPTWPEAPEGWLPEPGWKPDPEWPPAPKNWSFWTNEYGGAVAGPTGLYGGKRDRGVIKTVVISGFAFLVGLIISPDGEPAPAPAASTVTSTVTTTGAPTTVTVTPAAVTETVSLEAETVTQEAETVTLPVEVVTETVEVTETVTAEYVEADSAPGGGVVGFYDSGTSQAPAPAQAPVDVYYPNCTAAREAGAAPIYRGEPGYRSGLDRDNDGIACE